MCMSSTVGYNRFSISDHIDVGADKKRCHNRLSKGRMYLEYLKQVQQELLSITMWMIHKSLTMCSVLEEEDERGVAHIVEHLAFSATKKYTNHYIVKFLESIGAEFSACQNAVTSADETVYELFVPVEKPEFLSQAISVLAEFTSADLEKEIGVVMEKYRADRNANGRMQGTHWLLMMEGSKLTATEMSDIGEEYEVEEIVVAIDGHGSTPLTVVQLLWVNMIMDALGASALATKPPNDGLMNRPPVYFAHIKRAINAQRPSKPRFWSASGFVCGSASMFDLRLLSFVFSSKQDVTISSRSFVVFHGSSGVWAIGLVVLALWTTGLYHPS
ncbi:zinc protease PQQL-like protein [Tanacetum coccineum]|uniref:Zinc protease PQQL-like protein n=1 Tax=Tanacetum coccineum TaxID=301880 RepID=A0ABQ4ZPM1_9ASTR